MSPIEVSAEIRLYCTIMVTASAAGTFVTQHPTWPGPKSKTEDTNGLRAVFFHCRLPVGLRGKCLNMLTPTVFGFVSRLQ